MEYTRGSEWHKWDLHYHTPSSDDYRKKDKSNQVLVDELIAQNISAVVVTDHHIIDFERIDELNKLAQSKIIFLRGIEVTSELGGNESVHFIAIFPDNLREDEIRDSFLAPLGITKEKTDRDSSLYHIAIPYSNFLKCAHDVGALVSVHAGSKSNSIENIKNWCKNKQDFKQSILERIHILETCKKKDIDNYKDIVFKDIGKEMPIVVCSDYHSEYGYGEYLDNSEKTTKVCKRISTWIKSDLSFEGLKQTIFEPLSRVKVQENNPASEKFGLKLEKLEIHGSKLFNSNSIEFNGDMIAIIGEKGSGKTALLDMVAHVLGVAYDDQNSFIQRGKNELKDSMLLFNMYGAEKHEVKFNTETQKGSCRYINPSKLSTFCDNELSMQDFIKSIIMNDEITKEYGKITDVNLEIQSILLRIETLDIKLKLECELKQSIDILKDKIIIEERNKPLLPTKDEETILMFQSLAEKIDNNSKNLDKLNQQFAKLIWFENNKEDILNSNMELVRKSIFDEISDCFSYDLFKIIAKYDDNTMNTIKEYAEKYGSEKEKLKTILDEQKKKYDKLKTDIFKNLELQNRYDDWQKYIGELKKELNALLKKEDELQKVGVERNALFEKCVELYCSNIDSKKRIFRYFIDLKDTLLKQIGNVDKNKITFSPFVKVKTTELKDKIESVVSLKTINDEELQNNIDAKYKKQVEKLISTDDDLKVLVNNVINLLIDDKCKNNILGKNIEQKIFKNGHSKIDLYKIAFSDFIDINYEISFNGIPMDQLSSGQKGIVLLKLLLRLDKTTDPLLIDQPEDNLDNKSVYDQLVSEFQLIKQRRQLFIATHNPNLVINTDAEQVIVAEYRKGSKDGFISYTSGSIENKEIREKICKILEGGREAFIGREKRYNLVKNS